MAANRTAIGLGLAIRRWANRPPVRRGKPAHRLILASSSRTSSSRSLTTLAVGIGVTAAAAFALRENLRARPSRNGDDEDDSGTLPARRLALRRPRPAPGKPAPAKRAPAKLAHPKRAHPKRAHPETAPAKPAPAQPRGIAIAQLDLAIQTLQQARRDELGVAIHETRKAIKRARALERLLRDASSRARRGRRKTLIKAAAGELAGARDAEVAVNTLEGLMRRHPCRLSSAGVAKLHIALLAERNAAERAIDESGERARALRFLTATRKQTSEDRPRGRRREARIADDGLIRIYARGRRAMRNARKRKGIAEMHEWRKRAKDLRYSTEALAQSASQRKHRKRLLQIANAADALGEALGEEHDLALLAQRVDAEDEIFRGDKRGRRELRQAIRQRRKRLRKRAFKRGKALYARNPKRFRKQLAKAR